MIIRLLTVGHVAGDAELLARRGHELFAIGAECTHYHGPLAEGALVEDTVRCPGTRHVSAYVPGKRYAHRR